MKVYNEEGDPIEIEIPEGQDPAVYLKEIGEKSKVAQELQTKHEQEKKEWEQEKKELEEGAHPDWRKTRQREKEWVEKEKKYQEDLKKAGVTKEEEKLTPEQLDERMSKTAKKVLLDEHKNKAFSQFNEKDREVIKHHFEKLSAGEELDVNKVDQYIEAAARAAGIKKTIDLNRRAYNTGGNMEPKFDTDGDTPTAREIANDLGISEEEYKKGGNLKPI